jgi:hypothetical protein
MLEQTSEAESHPPEHEAKEVCAVVKEEVHEQGSSKRSGQDVREEDEDTCTTKRCKVQDINEQSISGTAHADLKIVPQQHRSASSSSPSPPSSSVPAKEGNLVFPAAVQAMLDHVYASGLCRQVPLSIAKSPIFVGELPRIASMTALWPSHMDCLSRPGELDTRVLDALRSLTEQVNSARGMPMWLLGCAAKCIFLLD